MKTKRSKEWGWRSKLGGRTVAWVDFLEEVALQEGPEPCLLRLEIWVMLEKVQGAEGSRGFGGLGGSR